MSYADDMGHDWDDLEEQDEIVARYRNWPIYEDVGGKLYVSINDNELYCSSIDDAKKEIDKAIKRWNDNRHRG